MQLGYLSVFRNHWVSVINAENCKRLIGIGIDGASANVAAAGLKGLVENIMDVVRHIDWNSP